MGYDIVSGKTKKLMNEDYENVLSHIQCQYAYKPHFRKAFGSEITNFSGRLTKNNKDEFIKGIDNFVHLLLAGIDVPMFRGNLSNCSQTTLIKEFEELRKLIENGEIGYIRIS